MFRAYLNDRAEIAFASIQEAAKWQKYKEAHKGASIIIAPDERTRTPSQNNALHLYLQQVADALNDAGLSIQQVLKSSTMDIEWTKEAVKEILWRTIQKRLLQKESTTELSKHEDITKVWEVMNRFLSQPTIAIESIPFPSYEPGSADKAPLKDDV